MQCLHSALSIVDARLRSKILNRKKEVSSFLCKRRSEHCIIAANDNESLIRYYSGSPSVPFNGPL